MIYIFDDRAQRRKDNEVMLRKFSDIVTFDTVKLIPGKSADECIFDSIEKAECIIFHKSYALDDENVTYGTIRELFASLDIPTVIFSGGTEGSNKSGKEINMNADLMYHNLPFFLEKRKENGVINIDTLLWGKHHRLNSLLKFQNTLSQKYLINNDPDATLDDIEKIKRDIKNSCREIHGDLADSIISDIDIDADKHITWQDLAIIIDNNIRKFE